MSFKQISEKLKNINEGTEKCFFVINIKPNDKKDFEDYMEQSMLRTGIANSKRKDSYFFPVRDFNEAKRMFEDEKSNLKNAEIPATFEFICYFN